MTFFKKNRQKCFHSDPDQKYENQFYFRFIFNELYLTKSTKNTFFKKLLATKKQIQLMLFLLFGSSTAMVLFCEFQK